jgi:plasmid stability protein
MAQVLVRNLDEEDLNGLKQLAQEHHRSLEGEIRLILKEAAGRARAMADYRQRVEAIRAGFGQQAFSDSADLIREDRDSR